MITADLLYKCITRSFLINECRITEFFSGYIVNFVRHVRSTQPDMMLVDEEYTQSKSGRNPLERRGS
ncbi:hypothetical protein TNCV_1890431 [Trichonephila clavipes]|nr:hypothetical protein TNCV_1890431 [Trichonephila clavipes]